MLKIDLWDGCTDVGKQDVPRTRQQRSSHLAVIVFTKDDIKGSNALNFSSYKLIHDNNLKIKPASQEIVCVCITKTAKQIVFKKIK